MTNDLPDERALAAYTDGKRRHLDTLHQLDLSRCRQDGSRRLDSALPASALRKTAERGLEVMDALITTWRRDRAEREAIRAWWEAGIKARHSKFQR